MLALGFQAEKKKKKPSSRSPAFKPREDSPDSVIFTHESNFSLFSSASASADRCSFASDFHDHESLVSELSKHLAGSELNECSSGPDLDPHNRLTVQKKRHPTRDRDKAKDWREAEEEQEHQTEEDEHNQDPLRISFTQALKECQDRRLTSEALALVIKPDRRRPASLDLNNPRSNVISSSPRLGGMKKASLTSRKSGTFASPGTPNYWQGSGGVQKGWSSERVPLPGNGGRRNVGAAMLPFNSGRTLPSKWEDAEKWIFSPVAGDGVGRPSIPLPQRRPKSKSGPLGAPGVAYYSMYSPSMPMFENGGGSVGNFMVNSPFSTGVMVADSLHGRGQRSSGDGGGNFYPVHTEPCITRSASVHGCLSDRLNHVMPGSQDEKLDIVKDAATMISRDVSRRDMATQMSPDGSEHLSPKERYSFSSSPPTSMLPIVELNFRHSSRMEIRDVQVDDRVTMTRWSKKHGARGSESEKGFANAEDWKTRTMETTSPTWKVSEASRCASKVRREEAKITAWENLQKAKAEAAIRKLEMKLEKKRSSSMDKIMNKLRLAQKKAQDMRSSVDQSHQITKASNRTISFRKPTQMASLSGCFTCHAF